MKKGRFTGSGGRRSQRLAPTRRPTSPACWRTSRTTTTPNLHGTDSIDFTVILDGELWLELDDGVGVHLKRGDTVVQNGTVHAWHNHSDGPCRFATVMIGAYHDKIKPPA
jgi:uncharacterized cupin superfamily protein